jgi:hypothetical protein
MNGWPFPLAVAVIAFLIRQGHRRQEAWGGGR